MTPLEKRVGDLWTTQIGLLIGIAAYLLLVVSSSPRVFIAATGLWAIGAAAAEPSLTTLLSKRAKRADRGAIMGLSDSVNSVAMIVGPAAGAAIVGSNPHLLPVVPALSSALAVGLGFRNLGQRST